MAAIWTFFKEKISVTAMLREQLAVSDRRISDLESKNAELQTQLVVKDGELVNLRAAYHQTEDELEKLKKEHNEAVVVKSGVEFRKGKRTLDLWQAFCPVCHVVLHPVCGNFEKLKCPSRCTWISPIRDDEIIEILTSGS